ncbi:MAG TPA: phospholipid carrier-dependent glycosyltransferase [Gemmataceae bacterium]
MTPPRPLPLLIALALLAYFAAQGLAFIRANSQTFDEAAHFVAGYSYLATGDFRVNPEHPPLLKLLWALPLYLTDRPAFDPPAELWEKPNHWLLARHFLGTTPVHPEELLFAPRVVNLGLGVLLVALVGWWGFRLWGAPGGLAAMAFAAFDPNLQAHSCVLSTDVGFTLFATLTVYLLWEYLRRPSHALLIAGGVALGLTAASKFSAVVTAATLALVVLLHLLRGGEFGFPGQAPRGASFRARLAAAARPAVRVVLAALAVLVLVYFVVEFPRWGQGLKQQFVRTEGGGRFYFLGEVAERGWVLYFPVAILIKTPLGTLLAVGLSLATFRLGKRLGAGEALFLLVPPLAYLAAMTVSGIDLGVRIVLPMFPFLFLLAGRLATLGGVGPLLVGLPLLWTALSAARVAPQQLAYFNEAVGGPAEGWRYLGDSNLDWGQGLKELRSWLERQGDPVIALSYYGTAEPERYGIRYQYLPGYGRVAPPPDTEVPPGAPRRLVAVSLSNLQGIYLPDPATYRWLLERTPVAEVGYSIRVYDLTDDPEGLARLRTVLASVKKEGE